MGLIVNTFRAALIATACAAPAAAQQAASIPVTIGHATRQDVPIFVSGIGTAQPFQSVLVRARVDGTLDRIAFTEGQDVTEGAELAEIDPRPYQAVLDQALAKKAADVALLANNRRDLARYADLAKNDFASRQSVDTQTMSVAQSIANIQSDEAAITAAKLNLEFTRITAPISGRVGIRMVDQGNLIHASDSTGIVIINQIKPISVIFTLPQDTLPLVQDATRANPNLPVLAFASDGETKLGAGALLTADNAIDTGTGTIRLKATFPNADERLWPGQFINAQLQLHLAKDAVVIPSSAVMRGPNGLYVYIVKPGDIAAVQPIKIGQDDGHLAVVSEGLAGAEAVVLSGQSRLTDGTKVSALPAKGAANQPAGSPAPAKTAG